MKASVWSDRCRRLASAVAALFVAAIARTGTVSAQGQEPAPPAARAGLLLAEPDIERLRQKLRIDPEFSRRFETTEKALLGVPPLSVDSAVDGERARVETLILLLRGPDPARSASLDRTMTRLKEVLQERPPPHARRLRPWIKAAALHHDSLAGSLPASEREASRVRLRQILERWLIITAPAEERGTGGDGDHGPAAAFDPHRGLLRALALFPAFALASDGTTVDAGLKDHLLGLPALFKDQVLPGLARRMSDSGFPLGPAGTLEDVQDVIELSRLLRVVRGEDLSTRLGFLSALPAFLARARIPGSSNLIPLGDTGGAPETVQSWKLGAWPLGDSGLVHRLRLDEGEPPPHERFLDLLFFDPGRKAADLSGLAPSAGAAEGSVAFFRSGFGAHSTLVGFVGASGSGSEGHLDQLSLQVYRNGSLAVEAPGSRSAHWEFGTTAAHSTLVFFERGRGEASDSLQDARGGPGFAEVRIRPRYDYAKAVDAPALSRFARTLSREVLYVRPIEEGGEDGVILVVDRVAPQRADYVPAFQIVSEDPVTRCDGGFVVGARGGEGGLIVRTLWPGNTSVESIPFPRFEKRGRWWRNLLKPDPTDDESHLLVHLLEPRPRRLPVPALPPAVRSETVTGIVLSDMVCAAALSPQLPVLRYFARGGLASLHLILGAKPLDGFDVTTRVLRNEVTVTIRRGGALRASLGGVLAFRVANDGSITEE